MWDTEKTPNIKRIIINSNHIMNFNDLIKLKNLVAINIKDNPSNSLPNLLLLPNLNYDLVKIDWDVIFNVDNAFD